MKGEVLGWKLRYALRAVTPFASLDKTRPHLNGVFLRGSANRGLTVAATNGHCLAEAIIGADMPEDFEVLIDLPGATRLAKALDKQTELVALEATAIELRAGWKRSMVYVETSCARLNEAFPRYRSRFPSPVARATGEAQVNARYLVRAAKAFERFNAVCMPGGVPSTRIHVGTTDIDPILFRGENHDVGCLRVVVMPMRG